MACDLLMKNKTAVLKKGVNHAEIIKDKPLDVQEQLKLWWLWFNIINSNPGGY